MTEEEIEKVAELLFDHLDDRDRAFPWEGESHRVRDRYLTAARAAITALDQHREGEAEQRLFIERGMYRAGPLGSANVINPASPTKEEGR